LSAIIVSSFRKNKTDRSCNKGESGGEEREGILAEAQLQAEVVDRAGEYTPLFCMKMGVLPGVRKFQ